MAQKRAKMVVGCPGSGKSWVCDQLKDQYHYVHHDAYIGMQGPVYVDAIKKASKTAHKTLLIEAPFSISQIVDPLIADGFEIEMVFIQEKDDVISGRYEKREKKPIPQGHLTRQQTYAQRARDSGSFSGTSEEVFKYLRKKR